MIISHISDTHGKLFDINPISNIVVHSGDMLPDLNPFRFKNREILSIEQFQSNWLHTKFNKIKGCLRDKPFLFINGNHDFLDGADIEKILRNYNINAHCLNNKIVEIDNVKFYGFPYVPYINGCWNNECLTDSILRQKTLEMVNNIKSNYIDFLVAHSPPYGILDSIINEKDNIQHIGNSHLINQFQYTLKTEDRPKWILCGHVHRSNGINCEWICNVSNAATVSNTIEFY